MSRNRKKSPKTNSGAIKNKGNNVESAQFAQSAQGSLKIENSEKAAAIEISEKRKEIIEAMGKTPYLPDPIFEILPEPLKKLSANFLAKRERDIFLLSAISLYSGIMPNIYGVYDGRIYYPNLYLLVIAPAASGKGVMPFAKSLVAGKHDQLIYEYNNRMSKYLTELADYKKKKKKKENIDNLKLPKKPYRMGLFIPGNSSAASVIDLLKQYCGIGIIFETEADTLGTSFKQDWGNFSDVLRNGFQHETISYSRKENDEYVEIKNPRLSVLLSGTPSQVKGILKNIEDGLVSRFMHYTFRQTFKWKDVSPIGTPNLFQIFNDFSTGEGLEICNSFDGSPIKIDLSEKQWTTLNQTLGPILETTGNLDGDSVASIITRSGVILFRIAMTLTALRNIESIRGGFVDELICDDRDFEIALSLRKVLEYHAMVNLLTLPTPEFSELNLGKKKLLDALPSTSDFARADALTIGMKLGIRERTVDKYLNSLVESGILEKKDFGKYARK